MARRARTMPAADALLEIGTEEIPARFLPGVRRQLKDLAEKYRWEAALSSVKIETYATPRRLVLLVTGVPPVQQAREETVLGPLRSQGFDAAGKPNPAAEGFARKHGVAVADLKEVPSEKGPRLAVVRKEGRKPAADVLPAVFGRVTGGLEFPRAMRWPQSSAPFARPIRWVLAMLGSRPLDQGLVEKEFGKWGVKPGSATRGRRFVHPKPLRVRSVPDYFAVMARAGVVLDVEKRKAAIRSQAERLAAKAGGRVLWDEDLLSEVADLVEAPAAVLGTYPRQALAIPQPVVVAAMQEHQRYFPVGDDAGKLLPFFIAVSNGIATKAVVAGNERVLKARLADARYFYEVDRKKRLEDFLPALDGVVWQAGAGSMRHKASRLESLAGWLAGRVGIAGADAHHVRRAALLCKADLVTQMVGEFPGLQGVTGGLYAMSHEPAEVAEAVAGHYRPAGPKDDVPSTDEGCAVALADKADSIAGHLALGHIPSGTADPYGLRRAGIGIIRIISEKDWRLSLSALAESAAGGYAGGPLAIPDVRAVAALAVQFLRGRMEAIFEEQGFAHDEIQASLVSFDDVVQAGRRLKALATLRHRPQFRDVIFALSRVTNIVPAGFAGTGVAPASLGDEERALYDAHEAVRESALALAGECKFEELYGLLSALKPPIDRFFEKVLVMEKDDTVRNRRLSLLKRVEESIRLFADVRRLVIA